MATNVLVQRAKKRLWGKRVVGLPPEERAEKVRLGPDTKDEWSRSVADVDPVAKRLTEEVRSRTAG